MLVAVVFSLAYSLRYISKVFLGQPKNGNGSASNGAEGEHKIVDVSLFMKIAMVILVVLVILIGIYPGFFVDLINSVQFG
jgi:NADH:ubiquinone oxidoreductase subunit 4 (subunit M)